MTSLRYAEYRKLSQVEIKCGDAAEGHHNVCNKRSRDAAATRKLNRNRSVLPVPDMLCFIWPAVAVSSPAAGWDLGL